VQLRAVRRQNCRVDDGQQSLTELDDRWILPFRGLLVTQVQVDGAFGLNLDDQGAVRISNTATLGWAAAGARPEKVVLDPERQDVAAGLVLFNTEVLSAVAFKSGVLRIVFSSGRLLRVDPDPRYEAWTATGPNGMFIVAMPGGDLAVWTARP
jgi:Family of unknown function (DUF6188)